MVNVDKQMIIESYIEERKVTYSHSLRDRWVLFREYINDITRRGEVQTLTAPLVLHIAPTNGCNLKCEFCYNANFSSQHIMPISLLNSILKEAKNMGVLEITLEGGEPFCHPDILTYIKKIKEYGFTLDILTNGTLINSNTAKILGKLLEKELDGVQVSLDGPEIIHDKARGAGTYQRTIQGIQYLEKEIPNIRINCVYVDMDYTHLVRFCSDVIDKTGVKILHFTPIIPQGKGQKFFALNYDTVFEAINIFLKLKEKFKGQLTITGSFVHDCFLYRIYSIQQKGASGCNAARTKLYIDSYGQVFPCAFLRSPKYQSYSLMKQSLSEIWQYGWNPLRTQLTSQSIKVCNGLETFQCPAMVVE